MLTNHCFIYFKRNASSMKITFFYYLKRIPPFHKYIYMYCMVFIDGYQFVISLIIFSQFGGFSQFYLTYLLYLLPPSGLYMVNANRSVLPSPETSVYYLILGYILHIIKHKSKVIPPHTPLR